MKKLEIILKKTQMRHLREYALWIALIHRTVNRAPAIVYSTAGTFSIQAVTWVVLFRIRVK